MGYRLAPFQRACRAADDCVIFLDIVRDRFLGAGPATSRLLLQRSERGASEPEPALDGLVTRGILLFDAYTPDEIDWTVWPEAQSSLGDEQVTPAPLTVTRLARTVSARMRARQALRTAGVRACLNVPPASARPDSDDCPAWPVIAASLKAQALLPRRPQCLVDSVTLRILLAQDHIRTTLVIGVQPLPFRAHCWLEHCGVVINDDSDTTRRFTPILTA
jgi:hypothetical protein